MTMDHDHTLTEPVPASVDHSEHLHPGEHEHTITDRNLIFIALFLAVLTALEVAATEVDFVPDALLIPSLLVMMTVKFFVVVLYFMHLKFDSRLFSLMFYIGLVFAVALYGVMLTTFHFFTG